MGPPMLRIVHRPLFLAILVTVSSPGAAAPPDTGYVVRLPSPPRRVAELHGRSFDPTERSRSAHIDGW